MTFCLSRIHQSWPSSPQWYCLLTALSEVKEVSSSYFTPSMSFLRSPLCAVCALWSPAQDPLVETVNSYTLLFLLSLWPKSALEVLLTWSSMARPLSLELSILWHLLSSLIPYTHIYQAAITLFKVIKMTYSISIVFSKPLLLYPPFSSFVCLLAMFIFLYIFFRTAFVLCWCSDSKMA